jgi:hypothetical protein
MFEYVNQGGCSCCGITHAMMDFASFADRCSDWETDDEAKEKFSPWPPFIHEEILTERARMRLAMKEDMRRYISFLESNEKAFQNWWKEEIDQKSKSRLFQLADEEALGYFRTHAKVKGSYEIVLCAVLEQIKHFKETGYKDGRIPSEVYFEEHLDWKKNCFTVDPKYFTSTEGMAHFFEMVRVLAGPKLLPARQSTTTGNQSKENNEAAEEEQAQSEANVQSFRSDRRLVRLVSNLIKFFESMSSLLPSSLIFFFIYFN